MVGKAKFDQEAAFKSIIGTAREVAVEKAEQPTSKGKNTDRVQRSYFLDRDIDKALRLKALEDERNLTETINMVLRTGLSEYLGQK